MARISIVAVLMLAACSGTRDAGITLRVDAEDSIRASVTIVRVATGAHVEDYSVSKPLPGTLGIITHAGSIDLDVRGLDSSRTEVGWWQGTVAARSSANVNQDVLLTSMRPPDRDGGTDAAVPGSGGQAGGDGGAGGAPGSGGQAGAGGIGGTTVCSPKKTLTGTYDSIESGALGTTGPICLKFVVPAVVSWRAYGIGDRSVTVNGQAVICTTMNGACTGGALPAPVDGAYYFEVSAGASANAYIQLLLPCPPSGAGGAGGANQPCTPSTTGSTPFQSGSLGHCGCGVCIAISGTISGWGCSSMDGRTVTVNGTPMATCGDPLPAPISGTYFFEISAGGVDYASFYTY